MKMKGREAGREGQLSLLKVNKACREGRAGTRSMRNTFSASYLRIRSLVNTFLPDLWNGWLKCCAIVHLWGGQRNILRVILGT